MAILRRFTPAGPADLDRRGVPRRDRVAARCSATASRSRRLIKAAIHDEVGLTASVGVASTKLVAKIASDLRKPDGLVVVPPGEEAAFLAPLPISRLWGVGEKTAEALRDFGVVTIGDLAALPSRTRSSGGSASTAARWSTVRVGLDPDPVATGDPAKSVGHEHTFDVDTVGAARRSSGRCWAWPTASRGGCASAGLKAVDGDAQAARLVVHDDHAPGRRSRCRPT